MRVSDYIRIYTYIHIHTPCTQAYEPNEEEPSSRQAAARAAAAPAGNQQQRRRRRRRSWLHQRLPLACRATWTVHASLRGASSTARSAHARI